MNARYSLITSAYNEEAFVERTLRSVVSQTVRPERWFVVDDGSTDTTGEIVAAYASRYRFVEQMTRPEGTRRPGFASKAAALNWALRLAMKLPCAYIGVLDADMELSSRHFELLLGRFERNGRLGVAGGWPVEPHGQSDRPRPTNRTYSVQGGNQLFRRECLGLIGGFPALRHGGEDAYAEYVARIHGWEVRSFPEIPVRHLKTTGLRAGSQLRAAVSEGLRAYFLGYDPLYLAGSAVRCIVERPFVLRSVLRVCAYAWAALRAERRELTAGFVRRLRREQRRQLVGGLTRLLRGAARE